ncbi:MAG: hypothetical protein HYS25_13185 [Ignavibacteriales bacterium]|nr:hypothetical protein [Ignavibacteriales bacterium]
MQLPFNGRIIIIDDNIEETKPLIEILSKKRIPFNYYSGTNQNEFPDNNTANKLRVLFLDLNIFELNKDAKTVISSIHGILTSFIPDNPSPYLLIIWSKQDKEYKHALEDHFKNIIPLKTPSEIIFLSKSKYFDYVDSKWVPQTDCINKLTTDLTLKLDNISFLRNLIRWENIVHESTTKTINEISSFYPQNQDWNKNTLAIIYKLAKSIIGNDDILSTENEQKFKKAFIHINSLLFDNVENFVSESGLGNTTNIIDGRIDEEISIQINTKLHTNNKNFLIDSFEPGNLYLLPIIRNELNTIIRKKVFKGKYDSLMSSFPWLVELDITPICDYSQDKEYIRTILGLALSYEQRNICEKKGDYFYLTPTFKFNCQNRFFLFDFRQIKTTSKEEIKSRKIIPILKLRRELCSDIQARLSNQINRPGVSFVE